MNIDGTLLPFGPTEVVLEILVVTLFLAFVRLVRGPTLPDRVVALDLIAVVAAGTFAVVAVENNQPVLMDAAIVVSLIAFLGTVAFARYVEKRGRDGRVDR